MKNRMIGLLTAALVVLTTFAMLFVVPAAASGTITVTVGSVSGEVGDVVEVPVSISAGSFLVNADMFVTFDTTKLELVDTYYEDPIGDEGDTCCYQVNATLFNNRWMYQGNEKTPGQFMFLAATGSNTGMEAGGVMFTLAFKILSEEADGTQILFTADPFCGNDGSSAAGPDGYPVDVDLAYTAVAGTVTIGGETTTTTKPEPVGVMGDMNGDGILNTMDALLLYGGVGGARTLTEEQMARADFSGDGNVNTMDALLLYKFVSGA